MSRRPVIIRVELTDEDWKAYKFSVGAVSRTAIERTLEKAIAAEIKIWHEVKDEYEGKNR